MSQGLPEALYHILRTVFRILCLKCFRTPLRLMLQMGTTPDPSRYAIWVVLKTMGPFSIIGYSTAPKI